MFDVGDIVLCRLESGRIVEGNYRGEVYSKCGVVVINGVQWAIPLNNISKKE